MMTSGKEKGRDDHPTSEDRSRKTKNRNAQAEMITRREEKG